MTLQIGILLALLCAFFSNLGFLYKHRGACDAVAVDMRHPFVSASSLLRSRWFAIGLAVATGAWVLHVAALAIAPMSVVQAVLAGGIVLLAVMAEWLFGFKVGRRQWIGVGLTGLGLFLLAITVPATGNAQSTYSLAGMIAFEGSLVLFGALLIAGSRFGGRPVEHHGVMLGAASGVMFGVSDIAIKAITGLWGSGILGAVVSPWMAIAVIGSIVGFYASARGLQLGEAVPVIAVTGTAANVSGIAGGIIVFGDPMPGHALGIVLQVVAFALVCVAAALTPAPVRAAMRPA